MKYNYQIARRLYQSTYENLPEQFKTYVTSLLPDEIDKLERDFCANGNGLLLIRDTESSTELFNSFAMFYYLYGRFPFTDEHLFVPDGNTPPDIIGDKLKLKSCLQNFHDRVQRSSLFTIHCCNSTVFCQKRKTGKIFLNRTLLQFVIRNPFKR